MIAVQNLTEDWDFDLKQSLSVTNDKKVNLFSFKVKLRIQRSNVRECFFQATSNSSWVNYGYLVAIGLVEDAKKELRMLSNLYGIGFILLDEEDPADASKIILPSKS